MIRKGTNPVAKALAVVLLAWSCPSVVWAATASCQSKTSGGFSCMEFSGTLPSVLRNICLMGKDQNTRWIEQGCPRTEVLAHCNVRREDGIQQTVYCYRSAGLADAKKIESCRQTCQGVFGTDQAVAGSGQSVGATVAAAGKTQPSSPAADSGNPGQKILMEYNTDRFGEDYKDFDLDSPKPELCAQLCINEKHCKAWTFVKPGVQSEKARCYLKEKVPPPTPDPNCVSGVKK